MSDTALLRLASLLDVEGRVLRAASEVEIAFVAVNEAHALTPYRQAVMWSAAKGVEAVSGLAIPERNAPFLLWIEALFHHLSGKGAVARVNAADIPAVLAEQWGEWLPAHALWLPLGEESGLLYAADAEWQDGDLALLARLAEAVTASLARFRRPSPLAKMLARLKTSRKRQLAAAALIGLSLFPVTGSVLAPAGPDPDHDACGRRLGGGRGGGQRHRHR